jgi:hypothetical protein
MYTTLNAIRAHHPCKDGWETLLKYLGKTNSDDETLHFVTILDAVGLQRALWCFRAVEGFKKEKLLLAITYAKEVEDLMPAESKKALDVFERYANGLATEDEFETARRAAAAAADARAYTAAAARAAASYAASYAAWSAAWSAADVAAHAAARAYTDAAAAFYADAAAAGAARATIQAKQETQLRELLERTQ